MKKKRLLPLLIGVAVVAAMCFAVTSTAFAAEKTEMTVTQEKAAYEPIDQSFESVVQQAVQLTQKNKKIGATGVKSVYPVPANTGDNVMFFNSYDQFSIKPATKGLLKLNLAGFYNNALYSAEAKTRGFSDYVAFNSYNKYLRFIGVSAKTYTFNVDTYQSQYVVATSFSKVKESKYGKKKSKAKKIKKKKYQKGLMLAGAQKAHWYKFKNPKNQKVKVMVYSYLSRTGTYDGGIKVTIYAGKQKLNTIIYEGAWKNSIKPYTLGMGKKLKKGTYYIKVAPYKKGTGYFKLRWQ